ncbi:hypothetical protein WOLCODRAFT_160089 [Wolfiporia cocos MD-104 SS10]|uniref:N-acetyltransferase domain-containing protein n=1 Tax=Wolfiporia cocos (strain MD-104) TaxID=742152 RepID=A0A2H3IU17_WOLCO|nr:hypothetical protein WOLCODRAFT_160089 [Wolfiporia cocos MD-104 SS10]
MTGTQYVWHETPECKDLQYSQIPHLVPGLVRANKDDPLKHYLTDTPDANQNPTSARQEKTALYLFALDSVRRHEGWTVGDGDALLVFSPASNTVPRRRKLVNQLFSSVIRSILQMYAMLNTKQQKKRSEEMSTKLQSAQKEALKGREGDLISLNLLATAPQKQGRGYASVLVDRLTAIADAQRRGIWLLTNLYTTGFYERFGFVTIKDIVLGDDDPTWTKAPVIVCIMLREPGAEPKLPLYSDNKVDLTY